MKAKKNSKTQNKKYSKSTFAVFFFLKLFLKKKKPKISSISFLFFSSVIQSFSNSVSQSVSQSVSSIHQKMLKALSNCAYQFRQKITTTSIHIYSRFEKNQKKKKKERKHNNNLSTFDLLYWPFIRFAITPNKFWQKLILHWTLGSVCWTEQKKKSKIKQNMVGNNCERFSFCLPKWLKFCPSKSNFKRKKNFFFFQ